jgi:hypothetical protein
LPGTNNLAYYENLHITDKKVLKHWPQGPSLNVKFHKMLHLGRLLPYYRIYVKPGFFAVVTGAKKKFLSNRYLLYWNIELTALVSML